MANGSSENVLAPVPHRQYVFTLPKLLRPIFSHHRAWLGELCRIATRLLTQAYVAAAPGTRPGLVLYVQTFGDLANCNPHLHVLATDGVFAADSTFTTLPPVPEALLAEGFRRAVLALLVKQHAITDALRAKILGWRHCGGFSVHNRVRIGAEHRQGRIKLACYMIRASISLGKMTYDAASGTVIYRSKMHAGLKRNFQVMPGAEWLELLCKHIPDRYEHLVRYVGRYSNRVRGERVKSLSALSCETSEAQDPLLWPESSPEPVSAFVARSKASWARLIQKIYEADPLVCPKCKGTMRVIALIDEPDVVWRILEHLGRWAPEPAERGPPEATPDWPQNALIPMT